MADRPEVEIGSEVPILWPDSKTGPLTVTGRWVDRAGSPVCIGVEILKGATKHEAATDNGGYRTDGSSSLSGADLRLNFTALLEAMWQAELETRDRARAVGGHLTRGVDELLDRFGASQEVRQAVVEKTTSVAAQVAPVLPAREPSAGVSWSDREHFRQVADVYRAAMRAPGRKRSTLAVKETFSVSHATATKWVRRARELGFLGAAERGKAGESTSSTPASKDE